MKFTKLFFFIIIISCSNMEQDKERDYKRLFNELVTDINILDRNNQLIWDEIYKNKSKEDNCTYVIKEIHNMLRKIINNVYSVKGGLDSETYYLQGAESLTLPDEVFRINKFYDKIDKSLQVVDKNECLQNHQYIKDKLSRSLNSLKKLSDLVKRGEISLGQTYYLLLVIENELLVLGINK